MWRLVIYPVCIGEAAVLAAILVAVVVRPDLVGFAPSPGVRQASAWAALALLAGCAVGVVAWLRTVMTTLTHHNL